MRPGVPTPAPTLLDELRRHRADLRASMSALEQALAGPGRLDAWTQGANVALVELAADFREHIDITEGPSGLYRELLTTAPRLSHSLTRLTREHAQIRDLVEDLLARVSGPDVTDVDHVRDLGVELLSRLARHRQRGSDLMFEAYSVDIGGET